mmetsp:Transcript_28052/g.43637  ORF Transcript_28052/g.43637 Transcript_28052/m.43637 type:complete len:261 (+) Transcript_28052:115-897(+)
MVLDAYPGFKTWIPPKPEIKENGLPEYEIIGTDGQICQIPLAPGQAVACDSGCMCYTSNDVKMEAKFIGFFKSLGRMFGGGSLLSITYTNESEDQGYVAMTPNIPGILVPIDMREHPTLIVARDSFVCSMGTGEDTVVGMGFLPSSSIGGFLFSGMFPILQKIEGGTMCFLCAMGTVITKTLAEGEEILVDTSSVLAMSADINFDVRKSAPHCSKAQCCGGEGLFNSVLTGPGTVWMQSFSVGKLRNLFPAPPPPPDNAN